MPRPHIKVEKVNDHAQADTVCQIAQGTAQNEPQTIFIQRPVIFCAARHQYNKPHGQHRNDNKKGAASQCLGCSESQRQLLGSEYVQYQRNRK